MSVASCRTAARDLVAHAAIIHRINRGIAKQLDAKHYRQAAAALHKATARHADAWAGYSLGALYAAGLGVRRDAHTAFHWYLWSAKRGNYFAQRKVANDYLHGEGTRRNTAAATYWFRIGIAPWQLTQIDAGLAQTYAKGHLAPVNHKKATYYAARSLSELRRLTREPNAQAAYFLGLDYAHGRGVSANRAEAVHYLCQAIALRDTSAAAAFMRLEGHSR